MRTSDTAPLPARMPERVTTGAGERGWESLREDRREAPPGPRGGRQVPG